MTGDAAVKRSALEGSALPAGVRNLPFLAQVTLRADPLDLELMNRMASAVGFRLPSAPNTASGDLERHALWLGPDEWLIVGPPGSEHSIESGCRDALGPATGAVVNVSANRTVVELRGPGARELLEAGCTMDLHPRAFHATCCAQTLVARSGVIIHQMSDEPMYRLFVRPSFAHYLATWLLDASGPRLGRSL